MKRRITSSYCGVISAPIAEYGVSNDPSIAMDGTASAGRSGDGPAAW